MKPVRYSPNGSPTGRKSKAKCKTCRASKGNPALRRRIYHAWFEREPGEETLTEIGQEIGASHQAIYRHAHNHLRKRLPKASLQDRREQQAQIVKAEAMKELELSLDHEELIPKADYERAIDDVLAEGIAQLKGQEKNITINQLIAAAKIKGDWAVKKRGQNTELIKMMYRSASGGSKSTQEPTAVGN